MTRLIVVDATPYGPEPSGTRRRAVELMRRLPALLPDDVFEMHWARDGGGPPGSLAADNLVHATVDVSCRGGAARWWRRRKDLVRRHAEAPFTHLVTDYGPVVRPDRVWNLVTVHDLRFLHGYGGRLRRLYGRFGYGRVLRRAAHVVAVAPSIAQEAFERFRLARRPDVVPNAVADIFSANSANGAAERDGLLVVGRDEPRKARGAAEAAAREAGVTLRVVDGDVDDAGLVDAYRSAEWLLAPSLLEGFHLPVVEALACGTPVIASDIPAHRDLVALGASGITIVAAPRRADGAWAWPEAAQAVSAQRPGTISPPPFTWAAAASALAAQIAATPA